MYSNTQMVKTTYYADIKHTHALVSGMMTALRNHYDVDLIRLDGSSHTQTHWYEGSVIAADTTGNTHTGRIPLLKKLGGSLHLHLNTHITSLKVVQKR